MKMNFNFIVQVDEELGCDWHHIGMFCCEGYREG